MANFYSKGFPSHRPPSLPANKGVEKLKAKLSIGGSCVLLLFAYSIGATIYYLFLLIYISNQQFSDPQGKSESIIEVDLCEPGWIYFEKTDFCYYYHNFTHKQVYGSTRFTRRRAEYVCQMMGGHLVSIHSQDEEQFIKELIVTHLRETIPNFNGFTAGCGWWDLVWIGMELTREADGLSNLGRWTDGSADDYYQSSSIADNRTLLVMCNDQPYKWPNNHWALQPSRQLTRFICKKASIKYNHGHQLVSLNSTSLENVDEQKCEQPWRYFNVTDFCYYYHNFTQREVIGSTLFTRKRAEHNCQIMGGHLVSIHSDDEFNYITDMIASHLLSLNLLYNYNADNSGCANYHLVWIGLEMIDEKDGENNLRRWTDGSPDDYFLPNSNHDNKSVYMLCNDLPVVSGRSLLWHLSPETLSSRYVCKKKPRSLR